MTNLKSIRSILISFWLLYMGTVAFGQTTEMDSTQSHTITSSSEVLKLDSAPTISFIEKLVNDSGLPYIIVIMVVLLLAYSVYSPLDWYLTQKQGSNNLSKEGDYEIETAHETSIATKGTLKYLMIIIGVFYLGYVGVKDTSMQGFAMEWLNLIVRWFHVVAGVMWIGASFYFIFLENNLNRTENVREELAGNLWAVHGGGFYF